MANLGYGHMGHVHVNEQNSFGEIFTDSLEAVPIISENFAETIEHLIETNMRARHAEGPTHEGVRGSAGTLTMEPLPDQMGNFLRAAAGQVVSTFVDSALSHVFTPLVNSDFFPDAAFPPMTIVTHRHVDSAEAFGDMVVNELTLEGAHSQLLGFSVAFMGGQRTNVAPTSPTFVAGKPWTWDQGSLSYGGVGVKDLRNFTVTLNNNVEMVYLISTSKTPQRISRAGFPTVTGTLNLRITAEVHSYFNALYQSQEESQVLLNFHGVTSPAAILIDVPKARITAFAPQISGPGPIEAEVQFRGVFDETSSYLCQFTLVNCRVSYP